MFDDIWVTKNETSPDDQARLYLVIEIEGKKWFAWNHRCYRGYPKYKDGLEWIGLECGRRVVDQEQVMRFLRDRIPGYASTLEKEGVCREFMRMEPLLCTGHGSYRGRWQYYLMRDVVRFARKYPRQRCWQCQKPFNSRRPIRDFVRDYDWDRDEFVGDGHPCCSRACAEVPYRKVLELREARARHFREVSCLRKQLRALKKLVRTGDPKACLSLPGGLGPARTSPSSCPPS